MLDSSVALAWCFQDVATEASDALLEALPGGQAVVPSLWLIEVANVLLVGERRGRIDAARSAAFLDMIGGMPIEIDPASAERPPAPLMALARRPRHPAAARQAATPPTSTEPTPRGPGDLSPGRGPGGKAPWP